MMNAKTKRATVYLEPVVVSTQVFQEFYVVSTGRLGVDPHLAKKI